MCGLLEEKCLCGHIEVLVHGKEHSTNHIAVTECNDSMGIVIRWPVVWSVVFDQRERLRSFDDEELVRVQCVRYREM